MIKRLTWLSALALSALALGTGCRGSVSEKPPVHLNPNMDNVNYLEAQEPSTFFEDGRAMRPQVEHTVAVGELRVDDHLHRGVVGSEWAAELPATVLASARPRTDDQTQLGAVLERGHERFEIYCTPCHGLTGAENGGIVPQRGLVAGTWSWAVPSLHGARQRGYPVGRMYDIVTHGINTMPAYAAQIPVNDRWAIAAYVKALQVSQGAPLDVIPSEYAREQGWN